MFFEIGVRFATSGSHWLANSIIRSIMAFCWHKLIVIMRYLTQNNCYILNILSRHKKCIAKSYLLALIWHPFSLKSDVYFWSYTTSYLCSTHIVVQIGHIVGGALWIRYITETSPYSFGNFRKGLGALSAVSGLFPIFFKTLLIRSTNVWINKNWKN